MLDKLTEYANTVQNTLYTGPNPPSPILLALLKLFVAALICRVANYIKCYISQRWKVDVLGE